MDDREVRAALEETQARLKAARAQVEDLEQRQRLAELNEQRKHSEVRVLEQRVAFLEARLATEEQRVTSYSQSQVAHAQTRDELRALEQRLLALDRQRPSLPLPNQCGKCGGSMLAVRVDAGGRLWLEVDQLPSATGDKALERSPLLAHTCEGCGFTELWRMKPRQG